jgi:hypothetical protein
MHFHSLYPAVKDARTGPNRTLSGQFAFPSDCHNLDRGGRSDYPVFTCLQPEFFNTGALPLGLRLSFVASITIINI